MDKLEMCTKDLSQEKIRMLRELFPNCVTETKKTSGGRRSVLQLISILSDRNFQITLLRVQGRDTNLPGPTKIRPKF